MLPRSAPRHAYPATPASDALDAWQLRLARPESAALRSDQGLHVEPLDPLIVSARPEDFLVTGFRFFDVNPPVSAHTEWKGFSLWLDYSPGFQHQALLLTRQWQRGEPWMGGPVLWIDGRPVAVPRDEDGESLLCGAGRWLDERFYALETGGLFRHPMFDERTDGTFDALGRLHGMLLCDAERRTEQQVLPPHDQRWTAPVAVREGDRLRVFASADAQRAGQPAWESVVSDSV
ncbi:MAG: hypothetical protein Q4G71_04000 [Pseudomonadota bacterium]|nr:hypothetical protein [Pseudomonadota bacterium]